VVSEGAPKRALGRKLRARTLRRVRSGPGVVKRQAHRSRGPECKLMGQGRSASSGEKPVATETWVLVDRRGGKQKSVEHIVIELRGELQGKPQEGDLARSSSPQRWRAGWGTLKRSLASGRAASRRGNSQDGVLCRPLYKQRSARNGVHAAPSPTKTARTVRVLSGVARRRVDVAAMSRPLAQARRDTARRKAFRVVPPSSLLVERIDSPRGRTVGRSWLIESTPLSPTIDGGWGGCCRSGWNRRGGARGATGERQRTGCIGQGSFSGRFATSAGSSYSATVRLRHAGCSAWIGPRLRSVWMHR